MLTVCSNPILLLETVAMGDQEFRIQLLRGWRGLAVDESIANSLFYFFCKRVQATYGEGVTAGQVLDQIEVKSPPTEKEIDAAWKFESGSSESGKRFFYRDFTPGTIRVH